MILPISQMRKLRFRCFLDSSPVLLASVLRGIKCLVSQIRPLAMVSVLAAGACQKPQPLLERVWASPFHGLTMWTRHSICLQTRGLVGRQGGPGMCLTEHPKMCSQSLPNAPQDRVLRPSLTALVHTGLQGACLMPVPLIRLETPEDGDCHPSTMPGPHRSSIDAYLTL